MLALYIRYLYPKSPSPNNELLASIFSLLALYFFTGMLNRDNTPLPIHLLFTLIIPIYFVTMPLLYFYCKRVLSGQFIDIGLSKHYLPALLIAFSVIISTAHKINDLDTVTIESLNVREFQHMTFLGALLPALLTLQTAVYFYLIFKMLNKYQAGLPANGTKSLVSIRFHWLLMLTIALLSNWVLRTVLLTLPFYFGDQFSVLTQAVTRLSMLLTVYGLAIYGLQQLTWAAYLKGVSKGTQAYQSEPLLDNDELLFLQSVLNTEHTSKDEQSCDENKLR